MKSNRASSDQQHYDNIFFSYTNKKALCSAKNLLPIVADKFPIKSIADFGCGNGGWLAVWKQLGIVDCVGIDGEYVDQSQLLIPKEEFKALNLTKPINLNRRFDLAQSLEVAEHLDPTASSTLIKTLTLHSDIVLFSAAPPGQGGMNHINEKSYDYWRNLFAEYDYEILDIIRPEIANNMAIAPWYRYNTFVFIASHLFEKLHLDIKAFRIHPNQVIPDLSPFFYKLRKSLLRKFPVGLMNILSRWHSLLAHASRKNIYK